ncbi:hypothetical protein CAAN1_06S00122 [[Candida] anglica]|uniref:Flo11 domain-containing protein n=1 Tax=[Candida] anglica TaxID=148631 RepID=A0ABP0EM31_9ASCO
MKLFNSNSHMTAIATTMLAATSFAQLSILFGAFIDINIGLPTPLPPAEVHWCDKFEVYSSGKAPQKRDTLDLEEKDLSASLVLKADFVVSDVLPVLDDVYRIVGNFETTDADAVNKALAPALDKIVVSNTGVGSGSQILTSKADVQLDNIAKFSFALDISVSRQPNNICCLPDDFNLAYHWIPKAKRGLDLDLDVDLGLFADVSLYTLAVPSLADLLPINPSDFLHKRDAIEYSDMSGELYSKRDINISIDLAAQLKLWSTTDNVLPNFCFPCNCPTSSSSAVSSASSTVSEPASSSPVTETGASSAETTPASSETTGESSSTGSSVTDLSSVISTTSAVVSSNTGDVSSATASSTSGDDASASASSASGDDSSATASSASGDISSATASGDDSSATVSSASGDISSATASGDESSATASGDESSATASGDDSSATASGDESSVTASGDGSSTTSTSLAADASQAKGGISTETAYGTTVVTITSCSDHVCTKVTQPVQIIVTTNESTSYTTYCPISTTSAEEAGAAPTSTPATTEPATSTALAPASTEAVPVVAESSTEAAPIVSESSTVAPAVVPETSKISTTQITLTNSGSATSGPESSSAGPHGSAPDVATLSEGMSNKVTGSLASILAIMGVFML